MPVQPTTCLNLQVKSFYVGKDHVGDVPLSKKIAAGFTTGMVGIGWLGTQTGKHVVFTFSYYFFHSSVISGRLVLETKI
jgi:hypothetical protein